MCVLVRWDCPPTAACPKQHLKDGPSTCRFSHRKVTRRNRKALLSVIRWCLRLSVKKNILLLCLDLKQYKESDWWTLQMRLSHTQKTSKHNLTDSLSCRFAAILGFTSLYTLSNVWFSDDWVSLKTSLCTMWTKDLIYFRSVKNVSP